MRIRYGALAVLTIAVGLLVHLKGTALGPIAQDMLGDALWAAMIFCLLGMAAPNVRPVSRSVMAYALCVVVETSQLIHTPAFDAVRATTLGGLVLGSGFDPRDLVAYVLGVAGASLVDTAWRRRPSRYRLVALVFAIGSIEHTVGLVGLWLGWEMYAHYPWWRHAAFAVVDASIAWVGWRRPDRLFPPLLAFFVEQAATNGVEAWQTWRDFHRVEWVVVLSLACIAAFVVATSPAFRARRASAPG